MNVDLVDKILTSLKYWLIYKVVCSTRTITFRIIYGSLMSILF